MQDAPVQTLEGCRGDLLKRLTNRRKANAARRRMMRIVEPCDGDLVGNAIAKLFQRVEQTSRDAVATADDRVRAKLSKVAAEPP